MRKYLTASYFVLAFVSFACSGDPEARVCAAYLDENCDGVPDDLGNAVYIGGSWSMIDFNGDGVGDGYAVDADGNGTADAQIVDLDGDGKGDGLDFDGDGSAEEVSAGYPGGSGTTGDVTGSTTATGATTADPTTANPTTSDSTTETQTTTSTTESSTTTSTSSTTSSTGTTSLFGDDPINMGGGCLDDGGTAPNLNGSTSDQYKKQTVSRKGVPYMFITNGWGDNSWGGHTIKFATGWTAFSVENYTFKGGTQNGVPAGYPALFCGQYSTDKIDGCGLDSPKAISSITSLPTGLKWSHPNGAGTYNVSYDVWLSTGGTNLNSYFMIWYRDPPGAQPAGGKTKAGVTVDGVPGTWDVWEGSVNGHPIVNYVRPENSPSQELFFDMKDFFDHAAANGIGLNGTHILGIAVGTEVWSGSPVQGLFFEDFCVEIK